MNLSRRNFGFLTAGLLASTALSACAGQTPLLTVSAFEDDLQLILNGVTSVSSSSSLAALVGTKIAGDIVTYKNDIQTLLTQIEGYGATVAANIGQPIVQQITDDVNSAIAEIQNSGVTIPADVQTKIDALETIVPIVLAAAQITLAVSAARTKMTPAQARAVLAAK